jgi:hypothetical protein
MDGANDEERFAKIWSSQGPNLKLGLIVTVVSYGVEVQLASFAFIFFTVLIIIWS